MIRSQLHEHGGDDPIWGFVAQLAAERFTGEAQVGVSPRVRMFVDEGHVYFAERDDDPPLQTRLVTSGVLTPGQLARGGIHVDGSVSLAKLFTRDSTVDREEVELTVERFTLALLDQVAQLPVGTVSLQPLHHHDTGINAWSRRPAPPPVVAPMAPLAAPVAAPLTTPPAAPLAAPLAPPMGQPLSAPPAAAVPVDLPPPVALPTLAASPTSAGAPPVDATTTGAHDRYTPMDFTQLDLPKLASTPMSVSEFAGADDDSLKAAIEYVPTDDALPRLAGTGAVPAIAAVEDVVDEADIDVEQQHVDAVEPAVDDSDITVPEPTPVDQLIAEQPTRDLDAELPYEHHDRTTHPFDAPPVAGYEPSPSWSPAAQHLAVMEIWEMVDELLAVEDTEDTLVTAGAPEQRHGRWRRGKKG